MLPVRCHHPSLTKPFLKIKEAGRLKSMTQRREKKHKSTSNYKNKISPLDVLAWLRWHVVMWHPKEQSCPILNLYFIDCCCKTVNLFLTEHALQRPKRVMWLILHYLQDLIFIFSFPHSWPHNQLFGHFVNAIMFMSSKMVKAISW